MPSKFTYVYILVSEHSESRHYVGITSDLKSRLKKHNEGGCPHTAKFKPWRIETAIAFTDKQKAIAFEAYLKSGSGREFTRRHLWTLGTASAKATASHGGKRRLSRRKVAEYNEATEGGPTNPLQDYGLACHPNSHMSISSFLSTLNQGIT